MTRDLFAYVFLLTSMLLIFASCRKEPIVRLPEIRYLLTEKILKDQVHSVAQVIHQGSSSVFETGFVYDTLPYPSLRQSFVLANGSYVRFEATIFELLPDTRYYIRAYATNAQGTSYSQQIECITPLENTPLLVTLPNPISISVNAITAGANILSNRGSRPHNAGFCYATHPDPAYDDPDSMIREHSLIQNTFFTNALPMVKGKTYYFRAFAINENGIGYGEVREYDFQ